MVTNCRAPSPANPPEIAVESTRNFKFLNKINKLVEFLQFQDWFMAIFMAIYPFREKQTRGLISRDFLDLIADKKLCFLWRLSVFRVQQVLEYLGLLKDRLGSQPFGLVKGRSKIRGDWEYAWSRN